MDRLKNRLEWAFSAPSPSTAHTITPHHIFLFCLVLSSLSKGLVVTEHTKLMSTTPAILLRT